MDPRIDAALYARRAIVIIIRGLTALVAGISFGVRRLVAVDSVLSRYVHRRLEFREARAQGDVVELHKRGGNGAG